MRYLLFKYNNYYPTGGAGDLVGRFSSLEDVEDQVTSWNGGKFFAGNAHLYDLEANAIVKRWTRQDPLRGTEQDTWSIDTWDGYND